MDTKSIIDSITSGDNDKDIDLLIDVTITRRKNILTMRTLQNHHQLMVGDRVRISDTVRPRYMSGMEGVVASKYGNGTIDLMLDAIYHGRARRYAFNGVVQKIKVGLVNRIDPGL